MKAVLSALSYLILALLLPLPVSADDDWPGCKSGANNAITIEACSRIIAKGEADPVSLANAYRLRGLAYLRGKDKDNEKAAGDLNQAISLDQTHAAYYHGLISYYVENKADQAIAEFGEAIKADPRNAAIYNYRGIAHGAKGGRDLAIADFSEAIRLSPKYFAALTNRSVNYRLKGEFDLAIADASMAIEIRPDHVPALVARGFAYEKRNEPDLGGADCTKAIELDPTHAEAYDCASNAHYAKHELDKAIETAAKAIGLSPRYASAYLDRGVAYAAKHEADLAIADYDKAIEFSPRYVLAYNNRALAYLAKKDEDRALAEYGKAIEIDPKYALAYYNRGQFYQRKKDAEKALADYRKVLELPALSVTEKQRLELVRQRIARLTQEHRAVQAPQQEATAEPNEDVRRAPSQAIAEQAHRAGRVALVIGNSAYAHAIQLVNPKSDAVAIAASLRRIGFDEVIELYDLDRAGMSLALKRFGDLAENADWAVVYFAGHGLEMNGVSYLIPTDAELLRDTHVTDEAISLTQVQAKADAAAKLGLVILDACRNNPFLEHMSRSLGGTRAIAQGLANVEPEGNVLVAYSAKHGTTALDGEGAHSPFTEALLNHIEEPGLEVNFLFRKVRDEVRSKTQRQQEPFLYGSLSAELLYFKATPVQ